MVLLEHSNRLSHVFNYVFQLFAPAYNIELDFFNYTMISK